MVRDEPIVVLQLDGLAERERHRRRAKGERHRPRSRSRRLSAFAPRSQHGRVGSLDGLTARRLNSP